jgi:hypothetical protein
MLHAPISEGKQQNAHTRARVETPRDHELHPRLGASVISAAAAGAAGEFASKTDVARGRQRWAGLHRAYGNEAVLGLLADDWVG